MKTSAIRRALWEVNAALLPGIAAMTWFYGIGILINLVTCVAVAIMSEAFVLILRRRSLTTLFDGSTIMTGLLIALCLSPFIPLLLLISGVAIAIVFGKQLFGGLGHNPFNPAMVGYAVLILSFPAQMTLWPSLAEMGVNDIDINPGLTVEETVAIKQRLTLQEILAFKSFEPIPDAVTMATPLDQMKFRGSLTTTEVWETTRGFGSVAGTGWEVINLCFLIGGIFLLLRRHIDWRVPLAMLLTIAIVTSLFYDSGSSESIGSPFFHLFSGGTMLTAFFIATDPVTTPVSSLGRWLFAIGVGLLVVIIRFHGGYPDGMAFAILMMNAATPLLDHWVTKRQRPVATT